MWGCMDTRSQSLFLLLCFYQNTNPQQPLPQSATQNENQNISIQAKHDASSKPSIVRWLNSTLFPSIGEICEFHDMLYAVWQWVKHESMNNPQSCLSWTTFNSFTNVFLNPINGQGKYLVFQRTQQALIERVKKNRLASYANHGELQFVWNCSFGCQPCNSTTTYQDGIHLVQQHFVSTEKKHS